MYIPPFWCGFVAGIAASMTTIVVLAIITASNDKK